MARKVVDANRSELDDLESDAAGEHLRKVLAKRLSLADNTTTEASSASESKDEAPKRSRIRLKTMPIPIPDRRAALRKSLAQPIDSEDD